MSKLIFHDVHDLIAFQETFKNFKTRITAKCQGGRFTYTVTVL